MLKEFSNRPSFDQIVAAVASVLGSNQALSKQVKLYFFHRYSGEKLKDIGVRFGIGDPGVSQSSGRILEKMKSDKKLIKNIRFIEKN